MLQFPILLFLLLNIPFLFCISLVNAILKEYIEDKYYDLELGGSQFFLGIEYENDFDEKGCLKCLRYLLLWFIWHLVIYLLQPLFILIALYFVLFDIGTVYILKEYFKVRENDYDFYSIFQVNPFFYLKKKLSEIEVNVPVLT